MDVVFHETVKICTDQHKVIYGRTRTPIRVSRNGNHMGTRKQHFAAIALIAMASLAISCGDMYSDLIENTRTLFTPQCAGLMVIYNANGSTAGTVPMDLACYQENDSVTVLGNIGALRGALIQAGISQRFTGWNTDAGGTETSYLPGAVFTMGGQTVTLYAQYTTDGSVLGKIGPAGGFVFYDYGNYIPGWRYMEVSPVDLGGAPYGPMGSTYGLHTFASQQIGQGLPNTTLISASCAQPNIAAKLCEAYELNGYADWYLPSTQEIWQIYNNVFAPIAVRIFSGPWCTVERYYWTTNEYSGGPTVGANALLLNLLTGTGYMEPGATKAQIMCVRAARRF